MLVQVHVRHGDKGKEAALVPDEKFVETLREVWSIVMAGSCAVHASACVQCNTR